MTDFSMMAMMSKIDFRLASYLKGVALASISSLMFWATPATSRVDMQLVPVSSSDLFAPITPSELLADGQPKQTVPLANASDVEFNPFGAGSSHSILPTGVGTVPSRAVVYRSMQWQAKLPSDWHFGQLDIDYEVVGGRDRNCLRHTDNSQSKLCVQPIGAPVLRRVALNKHYQIIQISQRLALNVSAITDAGSYQGDLRVFVRQR